VLSTRDAGPVIIMTSAPSLDRADKRVALEERGVELLVPPEQTLGSALRLLGERGVSSLLIEGGGTLHQAAWEEQLADYVRLYVTPWALGARGVSWLGESFRTFSTGALIDRRIETLGPDVLIEGYVHGPR
jgi:diaminohydroxyphosphoribosylaminopyrimidine deaminase/5-amino-6-(5-phosphoribosylamino)uracil reductase